MERQSNIYDAKKKNKKVRKRKKLRRDTEK